MVLKELLGMVEHGRSRSHGRHQFWERQRVHVKKALLGVREPISIGSQPLVPRASCIGTSSDLLELPDPVVEVVPQPLEES